MTKFKTPYITSFIIIILSIIASLGGLFLNNLYNDNDFVTLVWKSNDLLTLVIIIPLMITSLIRLKKNRCFDKLIWMGSLGYMIYNYIYYLYGSSFNCFFLIYVLLLTLSVYTIVYVLINININEFTDYFSIKKSTKPISIFMFLFAIILGGMWVAISMSYIFTKEVPLTIIQTNHPTSVVFATDLFILIPCMIIAGKMLWQKKIWGYIFSFIMLFKATTYGLALIIMTTIVYYNTGIKDIILPFYLFLWLGSFISLIMLSKCKRFK